MINDFPHVDDLRKDDTTKYKEGDYLYITHDDGAFIVKITGTRLFNTIICYPNIFYHYIVVKSNNKRYEVGRKDEFVEGSPNYNKAKFIKSDEVAGYLL